MHKRRWIRLHESRTAAGESCLCFGVRVSRDQRSPSALGGCFFSINRTAEEIDAMISAIMDDWSDAKSLCLLCCLSEAARSSSYSNFSASFKGGPFRKAIITHDVLLSIPPWSGSPPHCSLPPYMRHHADKKNLFKTWVFVRLLARKVSPKMEYNFPLSQPPTGCFL